MQVIDFTEGDLHTAEIAMQALHMGKRLQINYHGEPRTVEVHAVGISHKGKPCMRVFQVTGGAVYSGEKDNVWKMLSLCDVDKEKLLDVDSDAPREGYKPGDKGMRAIFLEINNHGAPQPKVAG